MALTSQQEAFALAVTEGKSLSDAYRAAYKADRMKAATINRRASELMADGKITARVAELRAQLAEKSVWTREQSARVLAEIAAAGEKDSDRVKAVAELNKMHGFNAPEQVEHSGTVTQITRRVVDPAKGSDD